MISDPTAEAPESELTSPCDDSRNEPTSAETGLRQAYGPISQMDRESQERTPPTTGLSTHPKAIKSRQYRQRLRQGLAGSKSSQAGRRPVSQKPLWTANQIREKLRRWDRSPFMDLLGAWLECTPTPEALTAFADRFPDRYASSLLSISKIAGFAERKEVTADISGTVLHKIEDMSDSQLEDHLRSLAYQMGIPLPKSLPLTITADAAPVDAEEAAPLQEKTPDSD